MRLLGVIPSEFSVLVPRMPPGSSGQNTVRLAGPRGGMNCQGSKLDRERLRNRDDGCSFYSEATGIEKFFPPTARAYVVPRKQFELFFSRCELGVFCKARMQWVQKGLFPMQDGWILRFSVIPQVVGSLGQVNPKTKRHSLFCQGWVWQRSGRPRGASVARHPVVSRYGFDGNSLSQCGCHRAS